MDDEVKYKLTVSDDRTKMILDISSTGSIAPNDYIMYLEIFLSDLIRAQRQRDETNELH